MKKHMPRARYIILILVLAAFGTVGYFLYPPSYEPVAWPEGKRFAFSIIDDCDLATYENVKPVYDCLNNLGLRTTKTVWVLPTNNPEQFLNKGQTLQDSVYSSFLLRLQDEGFEIALHGARGGSSNRLEIMAALHQFNSIFGHYPSIHVNHLSNKDNLYWGADKLSVTPLRWLYRLVVGDERFHGENSNSRHYWGDLAKKHISFVSNFSFFNVNLLSVNPSMPYHNPEKPCVNYWIHTSDGADVTSFVEMLSPENLDKLEREGGACIVYTHFGKQFAVDGAVREKVVERLQDVASRNGWFVPATQIFEYLMNKYPERDQLSFREQVRLELIWIWQKLIHGRT